MIDVPKYPELSIQFALNQLEKENELKDYIPDHWF